MSEAIRRRLTLIQGPPGTGKTRISTEVLSAWRRMGRRGQILAVADSNIAVDNLTVGCVEAGILPVRIGRRNENIRPEVEPYMLDLFGGANVPSGHIGMLKRAEVICCTCTAAAGGVLAKRKFQYVLMDEAAQCTEPTSIIPIMQGCIQLVLVGDHHQLPPTVLSRDAELAGLNVSLFDRLSMGGVTPFLLDTQYRMHPTLALFSSVTFYEGKVKSAEHLNGKTRPPIQGITWPQVQWPICFVNVAGREDGGGSDSRGNITEAIEVAQITAGILNGHDLYPEDIGLITPYTQQVREIRTQVKRVLGDDIGHRVEIASVDGFQGREKELIIFSAVRCNAQGNVGFLADWRRLNVLMTRARRGMIIVGSERTLLLEPVCWAPLLRWLRHNNLMYTGHPSHTMTFDTTPQNPEPPSRQLSALIAGHTTEVNNADIGARGAAAKYRRDNSHAAAYHAHMEASEQEAVTEVVPEEPSYFDQPVGTGEIPDEWDA